MKVIFLDIDGVLNSERSFFARSHLAEKYVEEYGYQIASSLATVDPIACDLINRLCKETDAKIVLSSTHRKYFEESSKKLDEIKEYLQKLGINSIYVTGFTESLRTFRGIEILQWLENNPMASEYIIIDDSDDMLANQKKFLIHVDAEVGFSTKNYRDAAELLGGKTLAK